MGVLEVKSGLDLFRLHEENLANNGGNMIVTAVIFLPR